MPPKKLGQRVKNLGQRRCPALPQSYAPAKATLNLIYAIALEIRVYET